MRNATLIICALATALSTAAGTSLHAAEAQKTEGNKGITVDDLGRGLKSAAQNIEKEIPKIGPAIGETFKKVTGKDKQSDQKPAKQDK